MTDLKEELKLLVKEKLNQFKIKIENKLYGPKRGSDLKAPKKGKQSMIVNKKKRKISEISEEDEDMSDESDEKVIKKKKGRECKSMQVGKNAKKRKLNE